MYFKCVTPFRNMKLLNVCRVYSKSLTQACRRCLHSSQTNGFVDSKDISLTFLDEKQRSIAVLGMNRPKAKNAFSFGFVSAFKDALNKLRNDKTTRVVILRSLVRGVFCAGADLKERLKMQPEEVGVFVSELRAFTTSLGDLPMPVIAAIDGAALGGGLEMALACDIRIASTSAKLGLVETKLAIIPGAGGTQRLPRIIGTALAKELIYTGRVLDGIEAKNIGLVNHAVEQNENYDAAFNEAKKIAEEIKRNGPIAIRLAKEAIDKGVQVPLSEGFYIEKECYARLLHSKDRIEGLNSFVEKRAPVYEGH